MTGPVSQCVTLLGWRRHRQLAAMTPRLRARQVEQAHCFLRSVLGETLLTS